MDWLLFTIFLAACAGAGATGSLFPPDDWYRKELVRPSWTPPDWLFPVAWTTLYLLMAAAPAIAAKEPGSQYALALWSVQIALNGLWSPVFFGLKRVRAAMGVVIALWLSVAATMVALFMLNPLAGALFLPYLVWVSVAGALNFSILRLNAAPTQPAE